MPRTIRALMISFVLFATTPTVVQAENKVKKAPEWEISQWFNGKGFTLADLKGKVVVIDFFQLWCPGCNSFSVPLMAKWEHEFADQVKSGKIQFVSIHTVFEGHDYQNPKRLKAYLIKKGIKHPVGIDRLKKGQYIPVTMRKYKTRGTPEMAIIDKQGRIRFQHFGSFDVEAAGKLIQKLLAE